MSRPKRRRPYRKRTAWTPEDEARLTALHAERKTDHEIAAAMEREFYATLRRRWKLGLLANLPNGKTERRKQLWTKEETETLVALHAEGKTDPAIARALAVKTDRVTVKRRQLGLPDARDAIGLDCGGALQSRKRRTAGDTRFAQLIGERRYQDDPRALAPERFVSLARPLPSGASMTGSSMAQCVAHGDPRSGAWR